MSKGDGSFGDRLLAEIEKAGEGAIVLADAAEERVSTIPKVLNPPCGDRRVMKKPPQDRHGATFASLAFATRHVEAVLAGEKRATLRLPDEYDRGAIRTAAKIDGNVLLTGPDGQGFATARVRSIIPSTPGQIAAAELVDYPNQPEDVGAVRRVLYEHYERCPEPPQCLVDVILFDVVEVLNDAEAW